MKFVTVMGSPRKKGNTAKVLGWVEERLESKGHAVDRVNIVDHDIRGCIECYTCQKTPDEPGCPQEDDALGIFGRMIASDGIIYGSPLFCWGYSSQIKPLIDRHFCLSVDYFTPKHKSLLAGKKAGLVLSCGGPEKDNTEPIVEMFRRLMGYGACVQVPPLIVPFSTTPSAMGDDIREKAWGFADLFLAP
jgi:multimeric flavodoxin WrbA